MRLILTFLLTGIFGSSINREQQNQAKITNDLGYLTLNSGLYSRLSNPFRTDFSIQNGNYQNNVDRQISDAPKDYGNLFDSLYQFY